MKIVLTNKGVQVGNELANYRRSKTMKLLWAEIQRMVERTAAEEVPKEFESEVVEVVRPKLRIIKGGK